ncbi:hypothetical protein B0H13DRAFT_1896494 [Mycena leptocephala]|nr:hypothetical protein B0H13DRAFT_1896494 [Mycena leptocephala]
MTDHTNPAPAAAPAAGAGLQAVPPPLNAALAAFSTAVDALVGHVTALSSASMCQMANAVGSVIAAAAAVHEAQDQVFSAVRAVVNQAPVPAVVAANSGSGGGSFLRGTGPWIAGTLYSVVPLAPLAAVQDNGDKWFSITRGKYVGLTKNAAISLNAITGVSTGLSEKHSSQADALDNFNMALATGAVSVI